MLEEGIPYNRSLGSYFSIPLIIPISYQRRDDSVIPLIRSVRAVTASMRETIDALFQDLACSGVELAESTPGTWQVRHRRGARDGYATGARIPWSINGRLCEVLIGRGSGFGSLRLCGFMICQNGSVRGRYRGNALFLNFDFTFFVPREVKTC